MTEKGVTLFLLRAYGDFVIALNAVSKSSFRDQVDLVASRHLEPLYLAIAPFLAAPVRIRFIDFKIRKQLMRCFTNRHFLHIDTITELLALRRYLHSNREEGTYLLEQQKRIFFPRLFCGYPFRSVVEKQPVYQSYASFFSVQESFMHFSQENQIDSARKILILPDSRQPKKAMDAAVIQQISTSVLQRGKEVSVAYFKQAPSTTAAMIPTVVYDDFATLITQIQASDLVIGSDSLPIHIAQLLGKPHYILYPASHTRDFFTPYALQHQTYFTFESLKAGNSFFE